MTIQKTNIFLALPLLIALLVIKSYGCTCHHARFDLDRFNRSFVPSMHLFSVMVLDANGNRIARLGRYGNADSKGEGSLVPNPDLGYAWVRGVGVSDKAMYAMDYGNKRVLKANLDYHNSVYMKLDGTLVTGVKGVSDNSLRYNLSQNTPNPFNPSTTIRYSLPAKENVKLTILDLNGKVVKVVNLGEKGVGYHSYTFNATDITSGIYLYEMRAGNFVARRKMALLR